MGAFSAALRAALISRGWSQDDLADRMQFSQSALSRYLVSDKLPKPETLEAICKQFDAETAAHLNAAYLTDQIMPSAITRIVVSTVREDGSEYERYLPGKFPPGSIGRSDLDYLERRMLEDPNLAKAVNFWVASLKGCPPHPDYYQEEASIYSVREDPVVVEARRKVAEEAGTYTATPRARPKKPKPRK